MRIKTQFIISLLLFGALIILVAASTIIMNQRVAWANQQHSLANKIAIGANELASLANDYVMYREDRQIERWRSRFASFINDVAALRPESPEQNVLVFGIQQNSRRLEEVFNSVVSVIRGSVSTEAQLIQVSWSRLTVQSQALAYDAAQLADLTDREEFQARQTNSILVVALLVITLAYIVFNFLTTQRRVLRGVSKLQRGAAAVGAGNLDYRIETRGKDEIGLLSTAFNRMASDLKNVTASKSDLETEIAERKKVEADLKKSEEKYRNLFSSMGEGFALHEIIVDNKGKPCNYRFLEMNNAFETLTGLDRRKVLGKKIKDILPDIEPYWIEAYGRVALTGKPARFENYNRSLDRWFWVYAYSPAKNQFAVLFGDITERKKAEQARDEGEREIRALVETANSLILRWGRDGRIKFINDYGSRFLGYEAADLVGQNVMKIIPQYETDGRNLKELVKSIITSPEKHSAETTQNLRKDVSLVQILWSNKAIYSEGSNLKEILSIGNDITGLKIAQDALKESEERWVTTLESIGDGVIATDTAGRITFMNGVAQTLTGWNIDEARKRPADEIFRIVEENSHHQVESPIARVIREGVVVGLANHTILLRKDSTEIPVDDSGAPILSADGKMRGVVLVFRDITERKKTERMKDEFLSLVSHELRTPLTVISGSLKVALDGMASQEDTRELLVNAAEHTDILADILENMLEMTRHQTGRLQLNTRQIDMVGLSNKVVTKLKGYGAAQNFIVDVPGDLPPVIADPLRVERVLHNLLENAVKYSPPESDIKIVVRDENGFIVTRIIDRGSGISPEDRKNLFQLFNRLGRTSSTVGTGLGLVVVKRLVEAHGGFVQVESELKHGSTFSFGLPLKKQADL